MTINDRALWTEFGDEYFDYFFLVTVLRELAHVPTRPWLHNEPVTSSPGVFKHNARVTYYARVVSPYE